MHSDKKHYHGLSHELKCQGHRKNQKPMPREQITYYENWPGILTVTGGQLMCQIYMNDLLTITEQGPQRSRMIR